MKDFFTPLRAITAVGLGMLLILWCCSMVGLMESTRHGKYWRYGSESFGRR